MLTLTYAPVFTRCEGGSEVEILRLSKILTFDKDSLPLLQETKAGYVFLSGLLPYVGRELARYKTEFIVKNTIVSTDTEVDPNLLSDDVTLRPYQVSAVRKGLYWQRGIIYMPTASGKTNIAAALVSMAAPEGRTLLLVPGIASLKQTARRFKDYGIKAGRIGDNICETSKDHTIAIVNSLYSGIQRNKPEILDLLNDVVLLQLMEAHHAQSITWTTVALNCPAKYRIALSATPFSKPDQPDNENDYKLVGVSGDVISYCPEKILMDKKWISTPHVMLLEIGPPPFHAHNNWAVIKKSCIIKNKKRNDSIVEMAITLCDAGMKVLTLVNEKTTHGHPMCEQMSKNRIDPVYFFHGGSKLSIYRNGRKTGEQKIPVDKLARDLMKRDSYCLVGSPAIHEDADFPDVEVLILAGAGRSFKHTIQSAGRALRGDGVVWVIDTYDKTGFVMLNQAKARKAHYLSRYGEAKDFKLTSFQTTTALVEEILKERGLI